MSNELPETDLPADVQTQPPVQPTEVYSGGQSAHVAGWRTSEFWMTTLSHLGLLLAAAAGALPSQYAAIAIAASQVAYNISRGLAKQNLPAVALPISR